MKDIFRQANQVIIHVDNQEQINHLMTILKPDNYVDNLEFCDPNEKSICFIIGPYQPKTASRYVTYRYIEYDFIYIPFEFRWFQ